MSDPRIRRQVAVMAARLMYDRQETEYFTAKRKAAKALRLDPRHSPRDLPANAEIRDEILKLAELLEGDRRLDRLREMRLAALRLMRLVEPYRPRLIGSVLTGHLRSGSDIDLHVFADGHTGLAAALEDAGYDPVVEHKRVVKHGEARVFTHLHVTDRHEYELTVYPLDKVGFAFKSSITGKAIEKASIKQLEALLRGERPDSDLEAELERLEDDPERWRRYRELLLPLAEVKQDPRWHPEGDALFHSLQVYVQARAEAPWDEEFLLAALLHDVGKGIDRTDHVAAGLEALEGLITPRTAFLIAHHMDAQAWADGTLGHRAKVRLANSEHGEELKTLAECDRRGRVPGAEVPSLDEALAEIKDLADG
jgi:predicted nucleotidyltransferase